MTSCAVLNPRLQSLFLSCSHLSELRQLGGAGYNQQENVLHFYLWVFTSSMKTIPPLGAARTFPKGSGSYFLLKAEMLSGFLHLLWFYWIHPLDLSSSVRFSTVIKTHQCVVHWKETAITGSVIAIMATAHHRYYPSLEGPLSLRNGVMQRGAGFLTQGRFCSWMSVAPM